MKPSASYVPPSSPAALHQGLRWRQLASPPVFDYWAGRCWPWLAGLAVVLALAGLWVGFGLAPTDHQQGEVYRIIFLHVPAAWMSMFIYVVAALHAGLGLIFRTRISPLLARALAPTGAMFTLIALWTGAAWGKPTWGAWWVWDARLTSELILLFLYLGYMGVSSAIEDTDRADSAGAIVLLAGVVNVPIIYFSVQWWSTLHQGASIRMDATPTMTHTMLAGMLLVTFACWAYTLAACLLRTRCLIKERATQEQL